MRRLLKFLHLSRKDRRLFIRTLFLLGTVRLALWLLPFRTIQNLTERITRIYFKQQDKDQNDIDRVVWAVKTASRYIPKATCLTQALTARYLLARYGQQASLRIGVSKDKEGDFEAHAWVESSGRILIGDLADHQKYTPFPPLDGNNT